MKPFNIAEFMNGAPAQTRLGREVKFVHLSKENIPARLTVGIGSGMEYYFTSGSWLGNNFEHDNDLIMVEDYPPSITQKQ